MPFASRNDEEEITETLKLLFRKDDDFRCWADQHTNNEKAKGEVLAKAV
jgi:hypothetical protein